MSLQWTVIAIFLYTEIALCFLLMLPFISAQRWQSVFQSELLHWFRSHTKLYLKIFTGVLIVLCADALLDVYTYKETAKEKDMVLNVPALELKICMALRRFYLSGTSLVLLWMIQRTASLLSTQANLEKDCELAKKNVTEKAPGDQQPIEEEKDLKKSQ